MPETKSPATFVLFKKKEWNNWDSLCLEKDNAV